MSAAADLLSTAAWETQSFPDQGKRNSFWSVGENVAIAAVLMSMMLLPLLDPLLRWVFGSAAQSTGSIVQHLVLVVGMLGGAIAAREQRLLALSNIAESRLAPQKSGFKRAQPPSRSQRRVILPLPRGNLCGRSATPDTCSRTGFPSGPWSFSSPPDSRSSRCDFFNIRRAIGRAGFRAAQSPYSWFC